MSGFFVRLILAVIYDISPVDLVPDVPPFGYIDDVIVTLVLLLWDSRKKKQARN